MTKAQEISAAIAAVQVDQARYPVGSIQRAQLQAKIDSLNFELTRGNPG
jgi:hypothetical protein